MLKFVKQIEINLSICPKKANGDKIVGFGYFKYCVMGKVGGLAQRVALIIYFVKMFK